MTVFKTIIPTAAVFALAFFVEACSQKASEENVIEFETKIDSIGYMVPDFYGDTVYSASKYSVVWPEKIGQVDFDALRDSLLNLTFGDTAATSIDEAAKRFLDNPLNELRAEDDTTKLVYSKVPYEQAYNAMRCNINIISSNVTLLNPDILVVQVNNEYYNYGAAHGMRIERFLNYSIVDHKLMTPENTFKPGNETAILDLINTAAREKYPEEGTLFDARIASFDNFQVAEDAIIFVYQPYDVAPYSTGIVKVPIPSYDLYRFLTPMAQKTLGLVD